MCGMKRFLILFLVLQIASVTLSTGEHNFNPQRFQAEMETYIVKQVGLTAKQSEKFLPLFREMQSKQRTLFDEMRKYRRMADYGDDAACSRAIQRMDYIDVQIRKIQQKYHLKFLGVLPAGVVMKILRAEDHFHRQAFRRAARGHQEPPCKK